MEAGAFDPIAIVKGLEDVLRVFSTVRPTGRVLELLLRNPRPAQSEQARSMKALVSALEGEPSLAFFRDGHLSVANTITCSTLESLASWLVQRAMARGAQGTVADLARFLTADRIPYEMLMVLGGLRFSGECQLEENVKLVSWAGVPESPFREQLTESLGLWRGTAHPGAALFARGHLQPGPNSPRRNPVAVWDLKMRPLEDLVLLLAIPGPVPAHPIGWHLDLPEWVPFWEPSSWFYTLPDGKGAAREWPAEGPAQIQALRKGWLGRTEEERNRLRISLGRLVTAMRRTDWTDMAIDLGIALECLLQSGGGRGVTKRFKQRGAGLLGETAEDRKALEDWFADMYWLRSEAVHQGYVPHWHKERQVLDIFIEGFRKTAAISSKIVRGGAPDWKDLLGTGSSPA